MAYLRTVGLDELKQDHTCVSLFSGCGGFDLGMGKAGFQTRVMIEFDKYCCQSLRHNWFWEYLKQRTNPDGTPTWNSKEEMKKDIDWYHEPEPVIFEQDIATVTSEEILKAGNLKVGETSVIIGGPPCQGFSTAGMRMIDDPRNKLFKEFVRIVKDTLPKSFIMENVPGLISMNKGKTIIEVCDAFSGAGYNVSWQILNAADFGVPQHRKRVFIVGQRIDAFVIPEEGNPQLHMGFQKGEVTHPESFKKKYLPKDLNITSV